MNYLYLVLSNNFGVGPYTTVHATEAGAQAAIADLGYGGFFVHGKSWDGEVCAGMHVRLGGVSTAYDDDFTSPTVRDESADESWGRIVEVLP
jgi:hypothetical protein